MQWSRAANGAACAGADEGAFAWLTLNYLLGHLGKEPGQTIAAIDLGGGSVQQAFAISEKDAASAPDGYITQLSGGGRTYHVYVHRWGTQPSGRGASCIQEKVVACAVHGSLAASACHAPLYRGFCT